jgi:hypothetical protein
MSISTRARRVRTDGRTDGTDALAGPDEDSQFGGYRYCYPCTALADNRLEDMNVAHLY